VVHNGPHEQVVVSRVMLKSLLFVLINQQAVAIAGAMTALVGTPPPPCCLSGTDFACASQAESG